MTHSGIMRLACISSLSPATALSHLFSFQRMYKRMPIDTDGPSDSRNIAAIKRYSVRCGGTWDGRNTGMPVPVAGVILFNVQVLLISLSYGRTSGARNNAAALQNGTTTTSYEQPGGFDAYNSAFAALHNDAGTRFCRQRDARRAP